jgi:hypothetical protein
MPAGCDESLTEMTVHTARPQAVMPALSGEEFYAHQNMHMTAQCPPPLTLGRLLQSFVDEAACLASTLFANDAPLALARVGSGAGGFVGVLSVSLTAETVAGAASAGCGTASAARAWGASRSCRSASPSARSFDGQSS